MVLIIERIGVFVRPIRMLRKKYIVKCSQLADLGALGAEGGILLVTNN